jgi:putative hydrolase of the HAD superfamily
MRLRALLFDYGGTLDAPGVPWVERFLEIYRQEGLNESEERIRASFGHATRCAYAEATIAGFGLEQTVAFHVDRQLEFLDHRDVRVAAAVAARFVRAARDDLAASRAVLERLNPRFTLGVVSNFYGNVHRLLAEADIAPLLSTIIDSTRVGVSKPDPAIFRIALEKVDCSPNEAMYVGDSFDKDVAGARAAGLHTAWLVGAHHPECPDAALVDLRLHNLTELVDLLP